MALFKCMPNCGYCCTISPVTVFPHEVIILSKLAEELDVNDLTFKPGYVITDIKNDVRVALSYLMQLNERGICPFLDPQDKTCKVHSLYKPLTCRSFPYLPRVVRYIIDPELKLVDFTVEFVVSSLCPVIRNNYTQEDLETMMSNTKLAIKVMPKEVGAAEEAIKARRMYADTLTALWRAGYVELRGNNTNNTNWPIVNAFDYIRQFIPHITLDNFVPDAKKHIIK
ncbi:YkgJ family cysteine cluster protein [Vulcanisaeta souniana]|uniref:YkgJ family cysteine cluster protein n=1 Tax=Vulcanisaeta souniana TaxID=164452 RepID=UPI001E30E8A6|nr:YkgJ family cysteine cluster protein [Vulcanisaeta souniana]